MCLRCSWAPPGRFSFFYGNSQYAKFAREGKPVPDALHSVLINSHGLYSYITPQQDAHLRWLEAGATILIAAMFALHLIHKMALKRRR
ncbi:MAG: hypothetical protein DMF76_18890 [Acidobacteria bacterium]|nr:MAG: hypothetical protein DMF76_18890 [Acidobacteriota bacterium]